MTSEMRVFVDVIFVVIFISRVKEEEARRLSTKKEDNNIATPKSHELLTYEQQACLFQLAAHDHRTPMTSIPLFWALEIFENTAYTSCATPLHFYPTTKIESDPSILRQKRKRTNFDEHLYSGKERGKATSHGFSGRSTSFETCSGA